MGRKQRKEFKITKGMETILEVSDNSLNEVDNEIEQIKMKQLENAEDDEELQEFVEIAQRNIENELQYMKKYYDPNAVNPANTKTRAEKLYNREAPKHTSKDVVGVTNSQMKSGPMTAISEEMSADEQRAARRVFREKRDRLMKQ